MNLYYEEPNKIKNVKNAIDDILWFYKCGKDIKTEDKSKEKQTEKKQKQIYSYEFDAEYIYSAFMEQYKIDLNSIKYLHWWKFKAMFDALKNDNKIVEIMGYRAVNLSKIKDKEMRKHYKKMQKLYALPDMRSEEEKENDFAEAFS